MPIARRRYTCALRTTHLIALTPHVSIEASLADAQADIARLQRAAGSAGITLRAAPEPLDPRTCCGRGCDPCMYTYYFDAVDAWKEEVERQLKGAGCKETPC
jgi:hypothetical protein